MATEGSRNMLQCFCNSDIDALSCSCLSFAQKMYNIVSNIQQSVYVYFDGVILFLVKCCCLITHHTMKGYGSVGITPCIFNSALDTGEW